MSVQTGWHLASTAFVPALAQLPASRHSKPSQQCITAAKFSISLWARSLQFTIWTVLALSLPINRFQRCLLTFQRDTSSLSLAVDYRNPSVSCCRQYLPQRSPVWGICMKCYINNFMNLQEQNCHKLFKYGKEILYASLISAISQNGIGKKADCSKLEVQTLQCLSLAHNAENLTIRRQCETQKLPVSQCHGLCQAAGFHAWYGKFHAQEGWTDEMLNVPASRYWIFFEQTG